MINILVTLDEKYVDALKVLLKSMFENNKGQSFAVYFMYSRVPENEIDRLRRFVEAEGHRLNMIYVDPELFVDSPVTKYYSMEMYYRLIAQDFLPENVDRVLYLDPDIVVINSLADFYQSPFNGSYYIASENTNNFVRLVSKTRLGLNRCYGYFNTGMLLMNIDLLRREIHTADILSFIARNRFRLILPDQDTFNMLYWDKVQSVDSSLYNYNARYYHRYQRKNIDESWIRENTIFLHYCGRQKPWHPSSRYKLDGFYHDYENMIVR